MHNIRKSVEKMNERVSLNNIGKTLFSLQENMPENRIHRLSGRWAEKSAKDGLGFDEFIEGLGKKPQENEMTVLRNLYENTPASFWKIRKEYLNIAADMVYGMPRYHYNEIYGIAAHLYNAGLTGETKFVSQKVRSGVYELRSIIDDAASYITIKNRDTKNKFKNVDGFAFIQPEPLG